jgi:sugar lactone lactonase YvrE
MKAGQVRNEKRSQAAVALVAIVLLLLTVFSGLALAEGDQGESPETVSLVIPDSMEELEALTEGGQKVDADPPTNPVAAEELPLTDLDRAEAENLFVSVFPSALEEQAGVFNDLEVEAFRSDNVAVVPPDAPGAEPGLLSSLLPLRTENEEGTKEPVSLELEEAGSTLEPANPLVEVQIPTSLDQGISLPESGVSIDVQGSADRSASVVSDAGAFYPNVAEESDLTIVPTPTGVETLTQLRSADSPTSQSFDLDLPPGANLQKTADGGADVNRDGDPLIVVRPPSAIDAEGEPVPVTMEVEGTSLILTADPATDAALPILVDPVFESYAWMNNNNNAGWTDWREATANEARLKPSWVGVWNETMHAGLNLRAYPGPITPGSQANWNYYVPRFFTDPVDPAVKARPTSFIRNMTLSQIYFLVEEGAPVHTHPYMFAGLWDENKGAFASSGFHNSSEGPYNGVTIPLPNPGEYTTVKNGGFALATNETVNYPRQAFVGSATVEITDRDNPILDFAGSVNWVNNQPGAKIPYSGYDLGLGVQKLRLRYPKSAGGKGEAITTLSCTGAASSPCPSHVSDTSQPISYDPSVMSQGIYFPEVSLVDAITQSGLWGTAQIKVDHDAPALELSGNLTEQQSGELKLPKYTLNYTAKDGDDAAAVASTTIGAGLNRPQGIAVDASGNTWVTDMNLNRLVMYDKNGTFVRQIFGPTESPVKDPRWIEVAPNGNLWVAELSNKRLRQFTPTGSVVSTITNAAFVEPDGVASGSGGVLWVTDTGARKIFELKEDGTLIRTIEGGHGVLSSSDVPYGIDVDEFGNAWVAMQGTNRILELSPSGAVISSFGSPGGEPGQLSAPQDVAVASSGNILVSDGLNRIQEFRPDGTFLRKFGTTGVTNSQFVEPRGIDVAPENQLVVADAGNHRIDRWTHVDQDPQSGAAKVEVKVDGALKATNAPGCSSKNCVINGSWTMNSDEYTVGTHKVEVIPTDAVGISAPAKTLPVETHGDRTAPTVALSGSITEQATLGKTLPAYKVKVSATDPGPAEERKSGVASIVIKVDNKVVDSVSPGCPAEGCSLTREWTLNSSAYLGWHWLEVVVTDAAGKSKAIFREFETKKDTTAPEMTLSGALPGAPEGWVQQGTHSATADATDQGGYGVKQIRFSIDGVVAGESLTQTCEAGSCPKSKTFWVDMSGYSGGAHEAAMVAEDLAGNVRKETWTINIDPQGSITAAEAEDTLEALDATSPVNTVGTSQAEVQYEGTTENLSLEAQAGSLVANGTAAPVQISRSTPGALAVEVPPEQAYTDCPNRPAEEAPGERTGHEEEQMALTVTCNELLPQGVETTLVPVTLEPVGNINGPPQTVTPNGAAAVAQNVSTNVDLVTRPLYDGAMTFAAIRDASGPESFSWKMRLEPEQQVELVDSKTVQVRWEGGPVAFTILATPAHDAVGTSVPTHLSVMGDILTLTVNHHGSPFVYPVVGGAGWEGGFQTYQIVMPSGEEAGEISEGELSEEGEYRYREATIGPPAPLPPNAFRPSVVQGNSVPEKTRPYNFHDCRFNTAGYDGEGPGAGQKREEAIKGCHGEEHKATGGYYTISWAVSVHGNYEYEPQGFVWLNARAECIKWGPNQPAKVNCSGGPPNLGTPSYPNIDVVGDYRFAPGKHAGIYGIPNAVCYRISGRLPNRWVSEEGGGKTLMTTFHTYRRTTPTDQKCDFEHLDKLQ